MKKAFLCIAIVLFAGACRPDNDDEPNPKEPGPYYFNATVDGTTYNVRGGEKGYKVVSYAEVEENQDDGGYDVDYIFQVLKPMSGPGPYVALNYKKHIADADDSDDMMSMFEVGSDTLNLESTNGSLWNLSFIKDDNYASSMFSTDPEYVVITISEVTDMGTQKISSPVMNVDGTKRKVVQVKGSIQNCELGGTINPGITNIEFVACFISAKTF